MFFIRNLYSLSSLYEEYFFFCSWYFKFALLSGMQNMQTKDTHTHLHERDDIAECLSKGKVAKNENTDYLKNGWLLENCEIC